MGLSNPEAKGIILSSRKELPPNNPLSRYLARAKDGSEPRDTARRVCVCVWGGWHCGKEMLQAPPSEALKNNHSSLSSLALSLLRARQLRRELALLSVGHLLGQKFKFLACSFPNLEK